MTTVAIIAENGTYRAVAGGIHSLGKTAGEALDALTSRLGKEQAGTLVVVQHFQPDRFFTAHQQARLHELMTQWRKAENQGVAMAPGDQAELNSLVETEVQAAGQRAAALVRGLAP